MKLIQLFKMLLEIKNKVEKLLKKDIEDEKYHKHQINFLK